MLSNAKLNFLSDDIEIKQIKRKLKIGCEVKVNIKFRGSKWGCPSLEVISNFNKKKKIIEIFVNSKLSNCTFKFEIEKCKMSNHLCCRVHVKKGALILKPSLDTFKMRMFAKPNHANRLFDKSSTVQG